MSSLNLSTNGPSISKSYQSVISATPSGSAASSPTYGVWAVFVVAAPLVSAFQDGGAKESVMKVQSTGEGELVDLIDEFSDGRIQFGFVKVKDPNSGLPKNVLIAWCGEGVPERTKGYFTNHLSAVTKVLHGYHVQITARSDRDLTPESIVQKVADSSGSKYTGGASVSSSAPAPAPPVASKPVFLPTRVAGGSGFAPLGSRSRAAPPPSGPVDNDGWGQDAPPVTRTQLEKVASAYQPTKVNLAELTSKREPSRFNAPDPTSDNPDVVKGGYQPIGKVDIAEIRRQAKASGNAQDDRPMTIKGAYEPVGKVDIAAIRARAQAGPASGISPDATGASNPSEEQEDAPTKSLAERSTAFQQSERLTSLPKPRVANKFGASSFTGTKAPAPGGFTPKANTSTAPVGIASRTFADEGGKTPAQIWAEKKARQGGGGSVISPSTTGTAPVQAQKSGGWQSTYTGKSWAPVQTTRTGQSAASNTSDRAAPREQEPEDDTPNVSSIRDRFAQAPPPMDLGSKPNAGARAVPPPPQEEEDEEEPYRPSSPIRIAQPVGRGAEPEEEHHASPVAAVSRAAIPARDPDPEPEDEPAPSTGAGQGGKTAVVEYDYEKAEENEIDLVEGQFVTNIEQVDDDWWMGQNEKGETGLFPSNYVKLVDDEGPGVSVLAAQESAPPPPAPAAGGESKGKTATAQYDYEAAEENELSFPDGATITDVEFPDEDWWLGTYAGKTGLFPANYVQLDE